MLVKNTNMGKEEIFMPQSPYSYSANNPVLLIDRNGLGPEDPTKPNFGYTSSNGNLIVSRITTSDRVIGEVSMAIVEVNPIVSGISTVIQIIDLAQSFGDEDRIDKALSTTKNIAMDGLVQPFEHAAREAAEEGGPTTKQLKGLANLAKGIGVADNIMSLYNALTKKSTRKEVLETMTFQLAMKARIITSINNRKGLARFNKKTTKQQGMRIMNSIYSSLNNILSQFDLENEEEKEAANEYLRRNSQIILMSILVQVQLEIEKDSQKQK